MADSPISHAGYQPDCSETRPQPCCSKPGAEWIDVRVYRLAMTAYARGWGKVWYGGKATGDLS